MSCSMAMGSRGGHSHRLCTSTRDRGQDVGQVAKVENLSSQRVKANFSWSKLVQRSTSGGCGLISFEVGQGSRPTFRCGQDSLVPPGPLFTVLFRLLATRRSGHVTKLTNQLA